MRPKHRRRRIQIVERIDIDPGLGNGEDQIGMTESKLLQRLDELSPERQFLLHKVGACHAQMQATGGKLTRDLSGGKQHQLHAFHTIHRTGIFTIRSRTLQRHTTRAEPVERLFHQAALGRHPKLERHGALSSSSMRPGRRTPPTAGISPPDPRRRVSAS